MGFTKPAWGRLWKHELYSDEVTLEKTNYSNPAMEAEFGIMLNRDLIPELVNLDYILASVETIHPIIEIHNLVFNGNPPFGAELLANNAIHAGVVIGKPTKGNIYIDNKDINLVDKNEIVYNYNKTYRSININEIVVLYYGPASSTYEYVKECKPHLCVSVMLSNRTYDFEFPRLALIYSFLSIYMFDWFLFLALLMRNKFSNLFLVFYV